MGHQQALNSQYSKPHQKAVFPVHVWFPPMQQNQHRSNSQGVKAQSWTQVFSPPKPHPWTSLTSCHQAMIHSPAFWLLDHRAAGLHGIREKHSYISGRVGHQRHKTCRSFRPWIPYWSFCYECYCTPLNQASCIGLNKRRYCSTVSVGALVLVVWWETPPWQCMPASALETAVLNGVT